MHGVLPRPERPELAEGTSLGERGVQRLLDVLDHRVRGIALALPVDRVGGDRSGIRADWIASSTALNAPVELSGEISSTLRSRTCAMRFSSRSRRWWESSSPGVRTEVSSVYRSRWLPSVPTISTHGALWPGAVVVRAQSTEGPSPVGSMRRKVVSSASMSWARRSSVVTRAMSETSWIPAMTRAACTAWASGFVATPSATRRPFRRRLPAQAERL